MSNTITFKQLYFVQIVINIILLTVTISVAKNKSTSK